VSVIFVSRAQIFDGCLNVLYLIHHPLSLLLLRLLDVLDLLLKAIEQLIIIIVVNGVESSYKVSDLAPMVAERVPPLVVHHESQMVPDRLLVLYLVELSESLPHDCDKHVQEMD